MMLAVSSFLPEAQTVPIRRAPPLRASPRMPEQSLSPTLPAVSRGRASIHPNELPAFRSTFTPGSSS